MGDNTIQSANSLFKQLKLLYPDKTDEELWGMIGLTPMIGLNDVHPEVFTLEDAEAVTAFARENRIRRIAMWSLGRDQECVSQQKIISDRCSGMVQEPFAYSAIFNQLTGSEGRPEN
jgi:chitinase